MTAVYGNVRHAKRCITVAAGITGVVAAHMVAYVLAFADPRQRADLLASTGHGYWSGAAGAVVLAAGVVVAAAVAHRAIRAGSSRVVPRLGSLAAYQLAMFAGVEVVERLVAGAPLTELLHGHEFAIGLALQIVVAAAVVVVLHAVERLGARVGSYSPPGPAPRRHIERPAPLTTRASLAPMIRRASRAPPRTRIAPA